jgi:hypothetical protein
MGAPHPQEDRRSGQQHEDGDIEIVPRGGGEDRLDYDRVLPPPISMFATKGERERDEPEPRAPALSQSNNNRVQRQREDGPLGRHRVHSAAAAAAAAAVAGGGGNREVVGLIESNPIPMLSVLAEDYTTDFSRRLRRVMRVGGCAEELAPESLVDSEVERHVSGLRVVASEGVVATHLSFPLDATDAPGDAGDEGAALQLDFLVLHGHQTLVVLPIASQAVCTAVIRTAKADRGYASRLRTCMTELQVILHQQP